MKYVIGALILICVTFLTGCYYDNEEELYPVITGNGSCDTVNTKYSQYVQPMLQENCYSCHNSTLQSGGVRLDTYDEVKIQAESGRLYNVMSAQTGYPVMPPTGRIDDCSILRVQKWISRGAQNN